MEKRFVTKNALETIALGEKIGSLVKASDVILLVGDLSAGKTTITKGIGKALGVTKIINSPTFTIVKTYKGNIPLYHLDLYRLSGINNDFDLEEYFEGDGVCVVEWPYQVNELLPNDYLKIDLEIIDKDSRSITVSNKGNKYERIVEAL